MSCQPFVKCYDFVAEKRKIVTFTDKNSKTTFIFENEKQDELTKYRVDGCLIDDKDSKCDFLLLNCTQQKSYFIELKGSDLLKAIAQIERSIEVLHSHFQNFAVEARIVLTRTNTTDLKSTKLVKFEKKLKELNGSLRRQNKEMREIN